MNPDFVYKQVLTGCLNAGVSQTGSRNAAQMATERYRKGKYKGKVFYPLWSKGQKYNDLSRREIKIMEIGKAIFVFVWWNKALSWFIITYFMQLVNSYYHNT